MIMNLLQNSVLVSSIYELDMEWVSATPHDPWLVQWRVMLASTYFLEAACLQRIAAVKSLLPI